MPAALARSRRDQEKPQPCRRLQALIEAAQEQGRQVAEPPLEQLLSWCGPFTAKSQTPLEQARSGLPDSRWCTGRPAKAGICTGQKQK